MNNDKPKKCVLCKNPFEEFGNNPWPLSYRGECCNHCNSYHVIPARLALHGIMLTKENVDEMIRLEKELIEKHSQKT